MGGDSEPGAVHHLLASISALPSHLPGGSIRRRECSDLSTNPALPRPSLARQDRVLALVSLVKEEEQSHLTGLLGKLKEIMGML